MLLHAMIFFKHSPPVIRRRKTSKLRSICKPSDHPALLQYGPQKVFIFYLPNLSHYYVYVKVAEDLKHLCFFL